MKRSKKYTEAAAKVDIKNLYSPTAAMKLAKETSVTKYDASVEVALVLGVDPKKADQAIRSPVNLGRHFTCVRCIVTTRLRF